MTKLLLAVLVLPLLISFGCKKTGDFHFTPITGRWYYTNSTADTSLNGQWKAPHTFYDSNFVSNFADSVQFTATDTVYYTYGGVTTWSNYKIGSNQLKLIGSGTSDTLTILTLNNTTLQMGSQSAYYSYWANFTRY